MYVGRYDYDRLRKAAIDEPTPENLEHFAHWFNLYGMDFWNGECWDADGYGLYPIYEWDEENDVGNIVGYELK